MIFQDEDEMEMSMKRILILGANPETSELVRTAIEMGIYAIVTDYNPDAPAKRIASKSYDIDCFDIDALFEMAKKENIDGVMVGTADILMPVYQELCERLGLPCYATREQVRVFNNKDIFKEKCRQYGIGAVREFEVRIDENAEITYGEIEFPVLVKPVDSCSGQGMTICRSKEELQSAIMTAMRYSRRKVFLVERYMECDEVLLYYTFQSGYYSLSMMADRFTTKVQGKASPVCLSAIYPSKYMDLYFETMHDKACRMFKDMQITDGVLLIQAFVENGEIQVIEAGYRLQGEAPHYLIHAVNGFDQRKMLLEFALTGKMGRNDVSMKDDHNLRGKKAASIWLLAKPGRIGKILGLEEIRKEPSVIKIVQRFDIGDTVTEEMIGTERQVFARIYIVENTVQEFRSLYKRILKSVRVLDTVGDFMLLDGVNIETLAL